jgi:hypothetical protein
LLDGLVVALGLAEVFGHVDRRALEDPLGHRRLRAIGAVPCAEIGGDRGQVLDRDGAERDLVVRAPDSGGHLDLLSDLPRHDEPTPRCR